ncbi:MAG: glycosyltransferase family 4 protein [Candidatus Cloacimonetes bacterium]|nr:glycosyltransferase family 4 protein [Candidatus Cloacimonadota bacterium]
MIYDMIYPFNVGGGEARNYLLAKELISRGHEVHFFGAKLWKGEDTIEYDGIVMHGVYKSKKLYKSGRRSYDEPMIFALKLFKPLFKGDFDIIDCTAFPFFHTFICKLYSVVKRKPLVLTWHEVWGDYWTYYLGFKGFFGKIIERLVSKLSKNHIVVSERTKKRLLKINPKAKTHVVPNALNLELIDSVKPSKQKFDLMFCGRLLPHKNIDCLVKAVRLLTHEFPRIKCLIIGKGPEKRKLIELAKKIGVSDNIIFKDFLSKGEDVYAHMKSSKIFVFPSILEGFGIVVIEAMACGLPVIGVSHKWNAAEDVINKNKAGFVVSLNAQEIAEKITYLLKKKRSYTRFVGNNVLKAQKYSIDKIGRKVEKIYGDLK